MGSDRSRVRQDRKESERSPRELGTRRWNRPEVGQGRKWNGYQGRSQGEATGAKASP